MPIQQSVAQQAAGQDTEVATLEEVVVLGSRVPTRSAHDSPVPIDVIEGTSMRNYGVRDMNNLLRATVPSYNVNQQPIGDAATLVRPANLRGLPPDSTLIMVNGKRRHRGSVLTFLGGGISDGAHATDLAAFPAIALKRVEILRDGAAAQYGSDAVAGVMNFVLKDAPDSGTVEARWGKYYAGDGDASSIAANLGMPLDLPFIQSGFANFSFEYGASDWTDRSVQRQDAQELIAAGNKDVRLSQYTRKPNAMVWGAPEVQYDYKLFGNLGMKLNSKAELYGWGNYAQRKIEGGFYYRNPNTGNGVFNGPLVNSQDEVLKDRDGDDILSSGAKYPRDYKVESLRGKKKVEERGFTDFSDTVKVANLDPAKGACPVVKTNDAADYRNDIANLPNNCFMFNEKFPGGFTPAFGGTVRDWSTAIGIRGDMSDWHYDLSAVLGQHSTSFFMRNTINPQLATLRTDIPTEYRPGTYTETDHTINLDLSRVLQTTMLPSPLNLGLGLEYRVEQFEVTAGDESAWYADKNRGGLLEQGFGVGSNGFSGFDPAIAGKYNRGSYAGYVDLETNVSKDLLVGLAGRYEKFETFGDTLNGKFNTHWQATPMMALRGSVSTGFRAPTVGQANIQNVTTTFVEGALADVGTFPASHPIAVLKGAQPLKPEKSFNLSAGTVVDVSNLSVTIDYYRIKVNDRIARSAQIALNSDDIAAAKLSGINDAERYGKVAYYANAFDTTTQGVDIVATYPMQLAGGNTLWTFAGNFNKSKVTSINNPGAIYDDSLEQRDKRVVQLEQTLPQFRFTLTGDHRQGAWRFLGRVYWYDGFTEFTTDGDVATRIDAGDQWQVDLETSYTMKTGLTISLGAQNLFDSFPDRTKYPDPDNDRSGTRYPEYSPYGFNGGYYYLRALYAF